MLCSVPGPLSLSFLFFFFFSSPCFVDKRGPGPRLHIVLLLRRALWAAYGLLLIVFDVILKFTVFSKYLSRGRNISTVYHISSDKRPKQHNELLSMGWLLGLQWERVRKKVQTDVQLFEPKYKLIPLVEMVPNDEVAEKIGDVSIVSGKVTLFTNSSEKFITLSRQPITLSKNNYYQCNLISADNSPMEVMVDQLKAGKVEVEAEIIVVKNTFSIIEPVVVPPCALSQNFSTLYLQSMRRRVKRSFVT